MKTLIAVPCMDKVDAVFAQNLAVMRKEGDCFVSFHIGSLIYDSRNHLAKQAIQANADYVLWLDSDMVFPADVMTRMIKHMEDGKDIVSGLYFRRKLPFTPVLFKELEIVDGEGHHEDYDDYPRDSVFEIAGAGFGCLMLKTEVLQDVMLNFKDWFGPMGGYGEDLSFCIRARELGYKVWCDSTIKCGHMGQLIVDEQVWDSMDHSKLGPV